MKNSITFNTTPELNRDLHLMAVENETTMSDLLNSAMIYLTQPNTFPEIHSVFPVRMKIISQARLITRSKYGKDK